MRISKATIIGGVYFLLLSSFVIGGLCLPYSYRVPGLIIRSRGLCYVNTDRQIAVIKSAKGGDGYRPVWSVSVFDQSDSITPFLYENVCGFDGDLSSISPYFTSQNDAQQNLDSFPAGSNVSCLYPSQSAPLFYPSGGSLFNINAVFLGDYTDAEINKGYHSARALHITGIFFICFGGVLTIGLITFSVINAYKFEIEMWFFNRKINSLSKS